MAVTITMAIAGHNVSTARPKMENGVTLEPLEGRKAGTKNLGERSGIFGVI